MRRFRQASSVCFLLCFIAFACGCAFAQYKESLDRKRADAQLKKERVATLYQTIAAHELMAGALAEDIRAEFGEPDGIFSSDSNVSTFQIWTYEKSASPGANSGDDLQPIRLYFDNGKLVTWKY
jgi:hypothetical protein